MSEKDMSEKPTTEKRKEALARQISNKIAQGYRVQSQSDYQAVLSKGTPVNHVLHGVLSLLTLGTWLIVWIPVALFSGEKREMASVDEFGHVNVSKV